MTPPEAAAGAFERHRARIEAVAARILGDPDEARDVASETYLALLERGPTDPDGVLPWLLTSARNRALNRVRDRTNERRKAERAVEPPSEDDAAFGDDAAAELVRRALDRLSGRDRTAVRMRYFDEAGFDQIATALGVSPAQARVVVHRAARRLRAATVDLLARHHHAPEACRRRLITRIRPHGGCVPCRAVGDEVDALSTLGLIPLPLAFAARALHRIAPPFSRSEARIPEAITALVVTGAFAIVSATPVAGPGGPAPLVRPAQTVRASAQVVPPISSPRPSTPPSERRATNRRTITDRQQDTILFHPQTAMPFLGVPLRLPDVAEPELERGVDIRAFEVATLVGAGGRADGLLMRYTLAGARPEGASYNVQWFFDDPQCGGGAGTFPAANESGDVWSASIYCQRGLLPGDTDIVNLPIEVRTPQPNIVEFVIGFSTAGETARMLRAGERIHLIPSTALGGVAQDYVPDVSGFSYRVEK